MRRIIAILAFFTIAAAASRAQAPGDTIPDLAVDSTLVIQGLDGMMPPGVAAESSQSVRNGLGNYVRRASSRPTYVFRIRIFMGNDQSAMKCSKDAETLFRSNWPEIRLVREYENPNFKVTAGGWKTRIEAESMLLRVRELFPDAVIIKDKAVLK